VPVSFVITKSSLKPASLGDGYAATVIGVLRQNWRGAVVARLSRALPGKNRDTAEASRADAVTNTIAVKRHALLRTAARAGLTGSSCEGLRLLCRDRPGASFEVSLRSMAKMSLTVPFLSLSVHEACGSHKVDPRQISHVLSELVGPVSPPRSA
jgi:hypothetical protein